VLGTVSGAILIASLIILRRLINDKDSVMTLAAEKSGVDLADVCSRMSTR
jgi:hypothetical protein